MSRPPQLQSMPDPALARRATDDLASLVFYRSKPARNLLNDPEYVQALEHASRVHGVGPLLGLRVERGTMDLGSDLNDWLLARLSSNRQRLARMHSELHEVLHAFEHTGVRGIPLKGTAMLLDGPEAIDWRVMADLDFLLQHDDPRKIDLTYAHAGYCLRSESWKHRVYEPCDRGRMMIHTDGDHPANPRDIESHYAVVEMFRTFNWDLTRWITNNLTERDGVKIPGDQAMALHLAAHASIATLESTGRMIQVVDLSHVLDRCGTSSIRTAVLKSGSAHHARFVYPALALVARWTGHAGAAALTAELLPYLPPRMEEWISTASFYDISWDNRDDRPVLDRLDLWARSNPERLRMLAATLALSPKRLSSAGYTGGGPGALIKWYGQHYRHLAQRAQSGRRRSS